jgi:diguanylate cyclase (GGDEF)-like protein
LRERARGTLQRSADLAASAGLARWLGSVLEPAHARDLIETLELLAVLRPREAIASLLLERVLLHTGAEHGAVLAPCARDLGTEVLAALGCESETVHSIWRAGAAVLASGKTWTFGSPSAPCAAQKDAALVGAVVPIAHAGEVLAALGVAHRGPGASVRESDLWLLEGLARHAAIALANARDLYLRGELDALTGVANHGRFWRVLEGEVERAGRYRSPLSVVMLDLDGFKAYNDALGHLGGDRALSKVADALARSSRASDTLARYGGEEFGAVLPQTSLAGALAFARKAVAVVRELRIERRGGGCLTVAAGAAELDDGQDARSLVLRADAELYRAKSSGGDCVFP